MKNKILVIEDDLALKPLWENIAFKSFGPNHLDWAVSGEEAKKLYLNSISIDQHYCLVVVDIFLAGSDTGLDFISYTRSMGQKTPILLVSSVSEEDLKKYVGKGFEAVSVLPKPLSVTQCEKVLNDVIQNL